MKHNTQLFYVFVQFTFWSHVPSPLGGNSKSSQINSLSYIKQQRNVIIWLMNVDFFFKGMGGAPFDAIFFITVFTETVKCL